MFTFNMITLSQDLYWNSKQNIPPASKYMDIVQNYYESYWIMSGLYINEILFSQFFSLLALQPPTGVVFYSRLVGFSLLAYEVS